MNLISGIKKWLEHPLTRGVDLDDSQMTEARRFIVKQNSFLLQIYQKWYSLIKETIPISSGNILELGSGAGFLEEHIPCLITSEIMFLNHCSVILDGQQLPFSAASLKAIVMTDVLHHIPNVRSFFSEATRVVPPGGVISMVEPWVSNWSSLIYLRLHHETFEPKAASWEFSSSGLLSGANMALPRIIFHRDRAAFEQEFPDWQVEYITPIMPFAYLASGGMSTRQLLPGWSFPLVIQQPLSRIHYANKRSSRIIEVSAKLFVSKYSEELRQFGRYRNVVISRRWMEVASSYSQERSLGKTFQYLLKALLVYPLQPLEVWAWLINNWLGIKIGSAHGERIFANGSKND